MVSVDADMMRGDRSERPDTLRALDHAGRLQLAQRPAHRRCG